MPRRKGIMGRARELALAGADERAILQDLGGHSITTVLQAIRRLRGEGVLPPRMFKLASLRVTPSQTMAEAVRRLATDRGICAHRIAHLAMAAGLVALENRKPHGDH